MQRSLIALTLLVGAPLAVAQITPERTYNGVDRPFNVRVAVPAGAKGTLEIRLLEAPGADVLARASVKPGRVNLAKALPDLWKAKAPRVLHAQLYVGGRAAGPSLVLQPLINVSLARLKGTGTAATIEFVPDEDKAYAGVRAWVDKHVLLDTTLGQIEFRMRPDAAPNTVWNFLELSCGAASTPTSFGTAWWRSARTARRS